MLNICPGGSPLQSTLRTVRPRFIRTISLESAINRGVRRTDRLQRFRRDPGDYARNDHDQPPKPVTYGVSTLGSQHNRPFFPRKKPSDSSRLPPRRSTKDVGAYENSGAVEGTKSESADRGGRMNRWSLRGEGRAPQAQQLEIMEEPQRTTDPREMASPERQVRHRKASSGGLPRDPISIPYTTAESEFLYGTSVVVAALQAARRKLHILYLYSGVNREAHDDDVLIRKLARKRSIPIKEFTDPDRLRLLDKMSGSRPHNGYVLEAGPLPVTPVPTLERVNGPITNIQVSLSVEHQSDTGLRPSLNTRSRAAQGRYPLVILLDGILDPGNFGAIIRTAYFMAVSAIAYLPGRCAPLGPVVYKSSAGAAEFIELLRVDSSRVDFVKKSQVQGWKVIVAASPESPGFDGHRRDISKPQLRPESVREYLDHGPCVLVLGGEGEGVSRDIMRNADAMIGMQSSRKRTVGLDGLDSLNVSVAAALLCDAFLHSRARAMPDQKTSTRESSEKASVESPDDSDRLF